MDGGGNGGMVEWRVDEGGNGGMVEWEMAKVESGEQIPRIKAS